VTLYVRDFDQSHVDSPFILWLTMFRIIPQNGKDFQF
jgi:hypothetical protein